MGGLKSSVYEVGLAKRAFLESVKKNARYAELPPNHPLYMSPGILMACAVAQVWAQAKAYQATAAETRHDP